MTHNATIEAMKQWCIDHYEHGADTMVQCWGDEDYRKLIVNTSSVAQAWTDLRDITAIYADH